MNKVNVDVKYAGFWIRLIAYLVDLIIFMIPNLIIDFVGYRLISLISGKDYNHLSSLNLSFSDSDYAHVSSASDVIVYTIIYLIQCTLIIVLYKYFLTSSWQATPGKRLMNVYVVDTSFNRVSSKKAIIRTALPIILSLVFITVMNVQSLQFAGSVSSYDNNLISAAKEYLPNSYQKHVEMGLSDEKIIESYSFAITLSHEIDTYDVSIDEMIDELSKEAYSYSDDDLLLKRQVLEEFTKLSEFDKDSVKNAMSFINSGDVYESPFILIFLIYCSILTFVWYIMIAFTKQKTALHDVIAKTRVIKGRP